VSGEWLAMPTMRGFVQHVGLAIAAALALFSRSYAAGPIQLTDVTRNTGITFVHTDGGSGRRYIIETVSAGLALFDYDLDGDIDIYFLNGAPLKGTKRDTVPHHALYRNDGNFHFTDVTQEAGIGNTGFGLGVTVGDYDEDGDSDLYLNNFGPNFLYRNNGDGTFDDVTIESRTGTGDQVGAGANFLDADQDGDLDLFVGNYLEFSYEAVGPAKRRGVPVYPAPELFPPVPNVLLLNNSDGTFTDVSRKSGIAAHSGRAMGTICADYDNDGDTDIFVANDSMRSFLFQNDGTGKFTEVGVLAGIAYDRNGNVQGNMGVACADYDHDGWFDFFVTTYQRQLSTLYRNLATGLFDDVTRISGAGAGTFQHVKWGTEFVDFDRDGDRDIFIACGHLMDNVEQYDNTTSYRAPNTLLMNNGRGKFLDVSAQAGDGMKVKMSSRGAAFDDLDGDGDVDVVIMNSREQPTILRNDSQSEGHWVQLQLRGIHTNRDAVGARVRVVAGELVQIDEVHSGRGYQSHYGTTLYIGLGQRNRIDQIQVRWSGGESDTFTNIKADQVVSLFEGTGSDIGGTR
jgi:hypothetical protein